MKSAIVSILGNVGTTFNSQGGAYGLICTKMVKDLNSLEQLDINPDPETWSQYDILYVCEGVNYKEGNYNIPGGIQPEHVKKIQAIAEYRGEIQFVNNRFDFNEFNRKRVKLQDVKFKSEFKLVDYFSSTTNATGKIVIGDSHSLSVWKPGYGLSFNQGKTLYGWLKNVDIDYINNISDETILYFGNIDIRYHLCRQTNPIIATKELFGRYVELANLLYRCTLVQPLPIEHESRKIPGSGLYKGQPFFGTREQRMEVRAVADEVMRNSGLNYITWPEEWIDDDGTKMLDILEQKQSVHLRPKYFPYIQEIIK